MKFNKIINELKGEIGDGKLYYSGRGQGSPNAELLQQKIVNAVYAFIRDNASGSTKQLWNELNIKDASEMDLTMNSSADGAIIKTEKGTNWIALTKDDPKTGKTKVISIKKS